MTIGPFWQGQTPGEPALVTITSPDGSPRDLTGYDAAGILWSPSGTDVSAGSFTQISDAGAGLVQFDFPVPSGFDEAGIYTLQFELTNSDPDTLDFTTTIGIEVLAALPVDTTDLVVTSDEVFARTNRAVGPEDIRRAQYEVSAFLGVDLSAAWATMTDTSKYWVSLAVSHQSTYGDAYSAPAGATSVRTGDAAITYGPGGAAAEAVMLHPMARICLSRISSGTMYATPFLGSPNRTPLRPMWVAL